jgi:hypothetical protein
MTTTHAPDVLPFASQVALLHGARWRRLAVLGDSIAEGVREPHPATATSRGSIASPSRSTRWCPD